MYLPPSARKTDMPALPLKPEVERARIEAAKQAEQEAKQQAEAKAKKARKRKANAKKRTAPARTVRPVTTKKVATATRPIAPTQAKQEQPRDQQGRFAKVGGWLDGLFKPAPLTKAPKKVERKTVTMTHIREITPVRGKKEPGFFWQLWRVVQGKPVRSRTGSRRRR